MEEKREQFPAHIRMEEQDGMQREIVQTVQEHCRKAARYAAQALQPAGLQQAAYLAALLHDSGKFTAKYRDYLIRAVHKEAVQRGSVNHTFTGFRMLISHYHDPDSVTSWEDYVSEILAYAIGAHHGLFDCVDERRRSGFQHRLDEKNIDYEEAMQNFFQQCAGQDEIDCLYAKAVSELKPKLEQICTLPNQEEHYDSEVSFYTGLMTRLILSAVIEGDRRDTAEFMNGFRYPSFPEDRKTIWEQCLNRLEHKLREFPSDTAIRKARQMISQHCRDFAGKAGQIYRFNVPTGAGKTLSSLRYAVAHARSYNKTRIIFTAPLLSILDQNAKVIREYVQDDSLILEHHSNVIQDREEQDSLNPQELMAENWSSPIIITTLVQLLNTLFSGRMTCIRRFQALCNSVIVIDEVQTVPTRMLTQFNLAMNFLSEICGATIILCSATQPCLEEVAHSLKKQPEDMVPYDPELWTAFRRTELNDAGARRLEDIPSFARDILEETDSLLIVCNKKDEAENLYQQLSGGRERCFHLSAAMCMAHRRNVLKEMEVSLREGEKTVCVATQVIEAGVDISFGRVIRLCAGMDSAVQAAGRCNRNGEDPNPAPVYLIRCMDENLSRLKEIERAKHATLELLGEFTLRPEQFQHDLASDEAIRYYYRRLYAEMPKEFMDYKLSDRPSLFSLLSQNEKYADEMYAQFGRFSLNQAFQTAGRLFQVFDSDTTDVIVPYGEGKEIIEKLCAEQTKYDKIYMKKLLEQAKAYTVSLYQYQRQKLEEQHALEAICEDSILVLQPGYYDDDTGLSMERNEMNYLEVGNGCSIQI